MLPDLDQRSEAMYHVLQQSPTTDEWVAGIANTISMMRIKEEIHEQVVAVFIAGLMVGEEASRVRID